MEDPKSGRASVLASFEHELSNIQNEDLREKVVDAWVYALAESEFTSIEQIRPSGNPDSPVLKDGTQVHHLRGVAWMAQMLADGFEVVHGELKVDRDLLWACALCHDVGKPWEFGPANQERWSSDVGRVGHPSIRHSVYGVHICLTVGLPEAVAHTAGGHSGEGNLIERSLENTLVHHADHAYWDVAGRANMLDSSPS